jgi:hypothetical protein
MHELSLALSFVSVSKQSPLPLSFFNIEALFFYFPRPMIELERLQNVGLQSLR